MNTSVFEPQAPSPQSPNSNSQPRTLNPEIAISVKNLTKIYSLYNHHTDRLKEALHPFRKKYHHDFYALRDVSFEIKKGETVGIIGKNGAGKSTLLKILTGVLTATSGNVQINGRVSSLLELGTGFNPELTGIENIYFNSTINGLSKAEIDNKVDDIISFADIGEFINQPMKTYSSGMFVRLAFAVATSVNPDILIIDEALSVGDMAFQTKCMKKIRRFVESSKTLIFVSHDAGAVKTLCERAILLDKGVVTDQGSPDKVFDYYNALLAIDEDKTGDVSKIEMDELRKRVGSRAIEITKVEMKNSKGIVTDTFVSGETVSIDITCHSNEAIESPTFGILIRDRLGNDIFGTNNFNMKIDAGKIVKGNNYVLRYEFNLNLGPNIYNLTAAVHDGMTHIEKCYDWINSILTFKVIPSNGFQFIGVSRLVPAFSISEYEQNR